MATLDTVLTEHGYKTLNSSGLVNNIFYYDIKDNNYNYGIEATASVLPNVTGSHVQITSYKCAIAGYNGVFSKEPTQLEINNEISRTQINFINEECLDGNNFDLPNITVDVNLNPWFYGTNGLSTASYSTGMQSLIIDICDYVKAGIQKLDLTTKNYTVSKYVTDLGISWFTDSETDLKNLMMVSPKYVNRNGNVKTMTNNTNNYRFPSPFQIFHSSYSPYGSIIQNTGIRIGLLPDEVGYRVNGDSFLNCRIVEEVEDPASTYTEILPAFKVNNTLYVLNSSTPYPTNVGLTGFASKAVNSEGQNLINGLIDKAILFMKANGKENNGVFTIPINMHVIISNPDINFISNKFGGKLRINLIYNPNDTTSNVVNVTS